jgi:hypothetical protein
MKACDALSSRIPRLAAAACFVLIGLRPADAFASSTVNVEIEPGYAIASERGPAPGVFVLTRTGDSAFPLSVRFTLSGTAIRDVDYQIWDKAEFEAGTSTTWVTILPRNDAAQEGWETVTLVLEAGDGYAIGPSSSATLWLADAVIPGFKGIFGTPGLFDADESRTDGVIRDILYLEAAVVGNYLGVAVALTSPLQTNVEVFLDTDQDPNTGDFRHGYQAGAEYRMTLFGTTGSFADYVLMRLPSSMSDCAPLLAGGTCEREVVRGTLYASGNWLVAWVPLVGIGTPAAVDVVATAHEGANAQKIRGNGDRAPEFGVLDTRTGQVVVRRPARTRLSFVSDDSRDATGLGFDLSGAAFASLADQYFIQLRFAQWFDPEHPEYAPGPRGEVVLDSDRSLVTGNIALGDEIPTWGGDVRIYFDFSTLFPLVEMTIDNTGSGRVLFADTHNDGRWVAGGDGIVMKASQSVYDAFFKTPYGSFRSATDGHIIASVSSLAVNTSPFDAPPIDALPGANRAIDTATGLALEPYAWAATRLSLPDPQEFFLVSGMDLIRVDAQVVGENLVVKGVLSRWDPTQKFNLFEILLDTDLDELTGELWANSSNGGAAIGADYRIEIGDAGGIGPAYVATMVFPDGLRIINDAILVTRPSSELSEEASFTVTIPLGWMTGAAPQCRLYVTTGGQPIGRFDTAPAHPMEVGTSR